MLSVSFKEIKIWLNTSRWLVYVKVYQEKTSMFELQWVTLKVRTSQQPDPVYHRGRPEHWHWTLSHLKEGGGTAQGLSLDTKGEAPKMAPWKNIIHSSSLAIDARRCDYEETCSQKSLGDQSAEKPATKRRWGRPWRDSQPWSDQRWCTCLILLPFSKNSDRRFKFFRDMDSDSKKNRFQRATLKSNKNYKHIFRKETVFLIL